MIVVERQESFFASRQFHQRRHVSFTRPSPRPRLLPRTTTLPQQTNARSLSSPILASRSVFQAIRSLRPQFSRPRPAWALPAPQTKTMHEASEPHKYEDSETEAEVEALLSFAEELGVEGLEEDMDVLAPSPSPPSRPSQASTPSPQARTSPSAERLHQTSNLDSLTSKRQPTPPCSPVIQALPLAKSSALGPTRTSAGTIHSARSVAALMERRTLAAFVAAEDRC